MVRRFNLADVLLIKRLQRQGAYLDLETALLWTPSPLWVALMDYFSLNEGRSCTLVLNQSSVQGFVQAWDRADRMASDVICLAPPPRASSGPSGLWHDLLERLCVDKGEQGVQRIFARAPDDQAAIDVFRKLGFVTYARQRIFRLQQVPADLDPPHTPLFRPLQKRDAWAFQRLRSSLTPRPVQQAEGGIKGERNLAGLAPWWKSPGVREYVWAEGDGIRAYLRLVVGGGYQWLRIMLGPEAQQQADAVLSEALALLSAHPVQGIYCGVPEYEPGLQGALTELGFQPFASESLMMKQTTVRVGVKVSKLSTALDKQVETAAPVSRSSNG